MQLEIKFKSIASRWFVNIFLIVAIMVCTVAVAFSVMFSTVYIERIERMGDDFAHEFSALSNASTSTFYDTAITIAGEFKYKNKIEVQVINRYDEVVVSTTGFQPTNQEMPDLDQAKKSGERKSYKGKSAVNEPILARTTPIYDSTGRYIGAYRWVTSLKNANKTFTMAVIMLVVVSCVILAFSAFSGMFFIKSIVRPIRDVSNIARKIAMGDFNARIEMKKNDEIGELCDTINYMASELDHAQNLKNDFISSVSHELRTPLTAIRGWGETAKMSIGVDEALVQRGLDVVMTEADRLSGLVEELLDFSRIENGKLSVASQPLNILSLLSEAVDMYTELAKQQGIDLIYSQPTNEITVLGDTNRLKQVFINIIDNAVKYTNNGGQVLVDFSQEEGCIRITVCDTGVGIPAQDIDRVKEKFYKANKTVRGSGIGLAVADEIIKQHQGLLFIESTEGVGTTATIVLPLYEPTEDEVEEIVTDEIELIQSEQTKEN